MWKLPINTHGNVIYALSCVCPIEVELKCRVFNFVLKCLNSDVGLVRSVTRHVISLLGCQSPIGKNFVSCSQFFSLPATVPDECYNLRYNHTIVKALRLVIGLVTLMCLLVPSLSYLNLLWFVTEYLDSFQLMLMTTYLTLMKSNQ